MPMCTNHCEACKTMTQSVTLAQNLITALLVSQLLFNLLIIPSLVANTAKAVCPPDLKLVDVYGGE